MPTALGRQGEAESSHDHGSRKYPPMLTALKGRRCGRLGSRLVAGTGLRIGEALAIRTDDF